MEAGKIKDEDTDHDQIDGRTLCITQWDKYYFIYFWEK
jgi:hypothetical protein